LLAESPAFLILKGRFRSVCFAKFASKVKALADLQYARLAAQQELALFWPLLWFSLKGLLTPKGDLA
jgi:hypothetical protein